MTIVYLKSEKSVDVTKDKILLEDAYSVWCSNEKILDKIKKIILVYKVDVIKACKENLRKNASEKAILNNCICSICIMDVIKIIEESLLNENNTENIEVKNIGETDVLIRWTKETNKSVDILKTIFVSGIVFFGTAFAIMSFNEDVAVESLFQKIYWLVNGVEHEGYGILEFMYGLGVVLGILLFFNHFGKNKITNDPTPIQGKMGLYENDIDDFLISSYKSTSLKK